MSDYAENAIDATIAHQPSPGERFYPAFEVTPELDAAASEYVTHYPEGKQKSAVLPILHEIQKNSASSAATPLPGWEKTEYLRRPCSGRGDFLSRSAPDVPWKNHIRVCRTLSCAMAGADSLFDAICTRLGIDKTASTTTTPLE